MNKEYIIFSSALGSITSLLCNAGVGHEEASQFIEQLFNDYKKTQLPPVEISWVDKMPNQVKNWMKASVENKFLCMDKKPMWIREPSWRFINEEPMIFINQVELIQNKIMTKNLSTGDVIYIFAGKKEIDGGWERIIKMVVQNKHSTGTEYVN